MKFEDTTPSDPIEPAPTAGEPNSDPEPTPAEPTNQVVEGRHIPSNLTAEDAADYEFIRDFVNGVPYAVDAVNAAKAA